MTITEDGASSTMLDEGALPTTCHLGRAECGAAYLSGWAWGRFLVLGGGGRIRRCTARSAACLAASDVYAFTWASPAAFPSEPHGTQATSDKKIAVILGACPHG
jgi:hypothetical protein